MPYTQQTQRKSHKLQLSGMYTAIVTPFTAAHARKIDEDAYRHLLHLQAEGGASGVVVSGTTGEGPTLRDVEFGRLIQLSVEAGGDVMQIIAGTGTSSTASTIAKSRRARECGAHALLIAPPSYSKPSQRGLLAHFKAVAESTDLPIILYNVPGRTAVNIEVETLAELSAHPQIIGVKEASGSINQIMDVIAAVNDDFAVLAGDDAITLATLAAGGRGVVSVAGNQAPALCTAMVNRALEGNFEEARARHYELYPLMKANFWESNPVVVKAALHYMGLIENQVRLPLVPMHKSLETPLKQLLQNLNIPLQN
ncbi:MAG: 4-hydroxy-tetrahydrodipicolinate synthase [Cyclonatronaceae bacterium]